MVIQQCQTKMYLISDKNLSVVRHDEQTDRILKTISSISLRFAIVVNHIKEIQSQQNVRITTTLQVCLTKTKTLLVMPNAIYRPAEACRKSSMEKNLIKSCVCYWKLYSREKIRIPEAVSTSTAVCTVTRGLADCPCLTTTCESPCCLVTTRSLSSSILSSDCSSSET